MVMNPRNTWGNSQNTWENRSDRLYELFINRLRHPYALCPMLTVSMINPHDKEQGFSPRRNGEIDGSTLSPRAAQGQPKGDGMYTLASLHQNARARVNPRETMRGAFKQAQVVGAVAGLAGGVFAATFGAMFTAISWFVDNEGARQWLSTAGTVLLFMTIPLIIFGAYCMDWMEKNNPQRDPNVARYEDDDDDQ
jgi:hypothetical protein